MSPSEGINGPSSSELQDSARDVGSLSSGFWLPESDAEKNFLSFLSMEKGRGARERKDYVVFFLFGCDLVFLEAEECELF